MVVLNDYASFSRDYGWQISTVSAILLYMIYWYRRPKRLPPGPRGFPIVGYLPFMGGRPEKAAYELSKKYGKILSVRLGTEDAVFLNDYELIYKAFVKNSGTLSGRRPLAHLQSVFKDNGIISVDYGPKLKSQRRFGLLTLRGFGVGKKKMESICLEELHHLNEELRKSDGEPYDIAGLIRIVVSNMICGIVLGQRFDYNDKQFAKIIGLITNSLGDKVTTFVNRLIMLSPIMQYIPPMSFVHKKFLKKLQTVVDWTSDIVKDHEKTYDENNIRDFIDAFIVEKRKGLDKSFKDAQLFQYIVDLFIAGTETTSSTVSWGLLCLIHYPETQKKLRDEIIKVVGSSGTISMSHKADMPYASAFIQELYRYRTLSPIGAPHESKADTELNGYVIPKGVQVLGNIWAVHHDPSIWKDPEKFCPERFLDEQGNFINSNYVIPFSIGPRHCLGEQLARMEVFIFLIGIVQKFEILPNPTVDQLPNIDDGSMGMMFAPSKFLAVAKEL